MGNTKSAFNSTSPISIKFRQSLPEHPFSTRIIPNYSSQISVPAVASASITSEHSPSTSELQTRNLISLIASRWNHQESNKLENLSTLQKLWKESQTTSSQSLATNTSIIDTTKPVSSNKPVHGTSIWTLTNNHSSKSSPTHDGSGYDDCVNNRLREINNKYVPILVVNEQDSRQRMTTLFTLVACLFVCIILGTFLGIFIHISTETTTTVTTSTSTTSTSTSATTTTSTTSTSSTSSTTTTTSTTTTSTTTSSTTTTTTTTTTSTTTSSTTTTTTTSTTTSSTTTTTTTTTTSTTTTSTTTATTTTTTSTTTTTTTTALCQCVSSYTTLLYLANPVTTGSVFTYYSYSYVPTQSCVTLSFGFQQDPSYWLLDDVSLSDGIWNFLVNGDFESGTLLPGWIGANHVTTSTCNSGSYCYRDGVVGSLDYVTQSFWLTVGQTYYISFYLATGTGSSGIYANITICP